VTSRDIEIRGTEVLDYNVHGYVSWWAHFENFISPSVGAALYSATHLHQYLAESQYYPMYPEQALCEAFKATDRHLLEKDDAQVWSRSIRITDR
jgi:hypothetical protein